MGITELNPAVVPKSPVAHVPFLAPRAITKKDIQDCNSFVIRKYYSPIRNERNLEKKFPIAEEIFSRIFSLPASPEMRLIPSSRIIDEVRKLGAFLGGGAVYEKYLNRTHYTLMLREVQGSNLITKIFDAHPKVCAPGASHLFIRSNP